MLLAQAKALELSRLTLYKNSTNKVISPDGKAVLLFLAKSEHRHFNILKSEIVKLKRINKLDVKNLLRGPIRSLFKKKERTFKYTISNLVGDINIIKAAIKLEKEDAPFYARLIKQTARKDGKKLFLVLKKEEIMHLIILKKKLIDLQGTSASLSEAQAHKRLF